MIEHLLDQKAVSGITGRAESTLEKDRTHGRGIKFVRVGRLVRYRPSDVREYLDQLPSYRSTSEADSTSRRAAKRRTVRVIVRLDPEEVAGVEMMAAGEDDLREGIGTGILVKHEPEASMTCRALAYAVEAGI
jgi:hypothetical protein